MTALSVKQQQIVALFQRHVEAELAGDLATTTATMNIDLDQSICEFNNVCMLAAVPTSSA